MKVYDVKYTVVTRATINGEEEVLGVEHKSDIFTEKDNIDVQMYLVKKEKMPKECIVVGSVSKS